MLRVLCSALALAAVATPTYADQFRGPGESPWHFRGDFGVPTISLNETAFAFALELGYFGESFLIGYDLAQSVFGRQEGETSNTNFELKNHFVLGYRTGKLGEARHAFLLESDFRGLSTDYSGAGFDGSSESSFLGRQSLVYGYTAAEDGPLFWGIFVGYGFQAESHSALTFGDAEGEDASELTFSGFALARFIARYELMPKVVRASFSSELNLFSMTRSRLYFGDTGADGVEEVTGQRLVNRLTGEVVSFEALGLHPLVFAGLDVLRTSGSKTDTSVTPVVGIGLTN